MDTVWVLASDHFLDTKFTFATDLARERVASVLGKSLISDEAMLTWNPNAENTLSVLLRYLRESVEWMTALEGRDREASLRPSTDLPFFANDLRQAFPFRHNALWADCDPGELRRYAKTYTGMVKLLEQADLPGVRNGLDHPRDADRFPQADRMLATATRLSQALEVADVNRLMPKIHWLYGRKSDRFGQVEYEFRDYAARSTVAYGPPLVSGLLKPRYGSPFLLAPSNLLGMPNAWLVFALRHNSEYEAYWKAYPRRRHIPMQPIEAKPEVITSE
jgi:hypothetical protein